MNKKSWVNPFLGMLLVGALTLAPGVHADQTNLAAGSVGDRFLNLPTSARSVALGGALGADSGTLESLGINPAGLSDLEVPEANFTHSLGIGDSTLDHLAAGFSPFIGAGFALGVDYLNYGSIATYSVNSSGFPQAGPTVNPYAMNLNISWAQNLGLGLQAGASAKYIDEDLIQASVTSLAADLGLHWATPDKTFSLGASATNLGSSLGNSSLPLDMRLGAAYDLAPRFQKELKLSADLLWAVQDQAGPQILAGIEYQVFSMLAVRGGYQLGNSNDPNGPTFGLGWRYRYISFDYADSLAGALGNTQQFTLTAFLPRTIGRAPAPLAPPVPAPAPQATPGTLTQTPEVDSAALLNAIQTHQDAKIAAIAQFVVGKGTATSQQVHRSVHDNELKPDVFRGDFNSAAEAARAMILLEPQDALGYQALGVVLWYQGDVTGSLENLQKAYSLDPSRVYLKDIMARETKAEN